MAQEQKGIYYTYILQSESTSGLYIGYTSDLEIRLIQHNESKGKYTSNKGPWILLFAKKHGEKKSAISLERKLKSWKSKKKILAWIEIEKCADTDYISV
jgi:putative endonuclease